MIGLQYWISPRFSLRGGMGYQSYDEESETLEEDFDLFSRGGQPDTVVFSGRTLDNGRGNSTLLTMIGFEVVRQPSERGTLLGYLGVRYERNWLGQDSRVDRLERDDVQTFDQDEKIRRLGFDLEIGYRYRINSSFLLSAAYSAEATVIWRDLEEFRVRSDGDEERKFRDTRAFILSLFSVRTTLAILL